MPVASSSVADYALEAEIQVLGQSGGVDFGLVGRFHRLPSTSDHGYYTPTYNASLTRTGPYQWPLYKRPADLLTDATGETAHRRTPDGIAYVIVNGRVVLDQGKHTGARPGRSLRHSS